MLVKSDFKSKLVTKIRIKFFNFFSKWEQIFYSIFLTGYSCDYETLLTCKWVHLLQTKLDEKFEFHPPKSYQVHKVSLVLNLIDVSYKFSLKFHFDFLNFWVNQYYALPYELYDLRLCLPHIESFKFWSVI